MKFYFMVLLFFLAACAKTSEEELNRKINACSAAGMDYTYLRDYKGEPYDVMCVARRLR